MTFPARVENNNSEFPESNWLVVSAEKTTSKYLAQLTPGTYLFYAELLK